MVAAVALAAVCAMRVLRQRANGAARCNAVALVLMQAGRVSPARTRTAAESTSGPIVAAASTDIDGNGCICVEPALRRCGMRFRRRARCWCARNRVADPRAQHASVGRGTERADVPGMRCCCSCFGANGAARCDGVALVLMQAGRVSPARSSDGSLVNFRPHRRCCEHRYRRKWLVSASSLRWLCALPMRVRLLHALAS